MQEKYGFVYIWYDRKHKRYYLGCHWGHEDDEYICSSKWMRDAYRRRKHDFKRRIVARILSTREDLFDKEFQWLSLIKDGELGNRYYNLSRNHPKHWSVIENNFDSVSEKVSKSWTPERRQRHKEIMSIKSAGNTNRQGKTASDETREKISRSKTGKPGWNKGIPKSEETKQKISETAKSQNRTGTFLGKTHSDEAKRKMSEAKKGRTPWNKGMRKSSQSSGSKRCHEQYQ